MDKVIVDWEEEERKIQEQYKKQMEELKKRKKESQLVGNVLTKGILPVLVMHLVGKSPANGNEISTTIGTITNGKWIPSTGGIYPILKKMEKSGFMESNWDDPEKRIKKTYSLTEKGQKEVAIQRSVLSENVNQTVEILQGILNSINE